MGEVIGWRLIRSFRRVKRCGLSLLRISLPRDATLVIAALVLVPLHQALGLGRAHLLSFAMYCLVTRTAALRLGLGLPDKYQTIVYIAGNLTASSEFVRCDKFS